MHDHKGELIEIIYLESHKAFDRFTSKWVILGLGMGCFILHWEPSQTLKTISGLKSYNSLVLVILQPLLPQDEFLQDPEWSFRGANSISLLLLNTFKGFHCFRTALELNMLHVSFSVSLAARTHPHNLSSATPMPWIQEQVMGKYSGLEELFPVAVFVTHLSSRANRGSLSVRVSVPSAQG